MHLTTTAVATWKQLMVFGLALFISHIFLIAFGLLL